MKVKTKEICECVKVERDKLDELESLLIKNGINCFNERETDIILAIPDNIIEIPYGGYIIFYCEGNIEFAHNYEELKEDFEIIEE